MGHEHGERCQACGDHYDTVWSAPDDIWNQVTPFQDGTGLLCLRCFDNLARRQGFYLEWVVKEGYR